MTKPPEQRNLAHSLIVGNAGERAMELCDQLAREMSKRIEIYPVGSPWRTEAGGAAAPGDSAGE